MNVECYSKENSSEYGRIHPRSAKLLVLTLAITLQVEISFGRHLHKPQPTDIK